MPNHPISFYLKWDPKPQHNQPCCQPSGNYRPIQMQQIVPFLQNHVHGEYRNTPKTHTGNKAQVACTFPLDPTASYEPV